ncbi:MAG: hypothetical protein SVO26_07650 [Chloroflexota bacterium]|nr:hypothetical protein [Chloroflexota bacterium]
MKLKRIIPTAGVILFFSSDQSQIATVKVVSEEQIRKQVIDILPEASMIEPTTGEALR